MSQGGSFLQGLFDLLSRLFSPPPEPPAETPPPASSPEVAPAAITPLAPRVLMIVYNPVVDPASGRRLIQTLGWSDPEQLAAGYIADVQECSGGLVNYSVVDRIQADEVPAKADGFRYTAASYMSCRQKGSGFHDPDAVDYASIILNFDLLNRVTRDEIDEVWLFGGPYFGFYESTMVGAGAFFCNAPPVENTSQCKKRFVIMGFNYERGVGEMLEDLGHRAESVLREVFQNKSGDANLFDRYARYDQVAPGQANVGLLHFAPNSVRDYDWGNPTRVQSCCDDWLQFPALPNPAKYRTVDCGDWGNGDIRLHHQWWFKHLPKVPGETNGVSNFWWKYFIGVNDPVFDRR